VKQLNRQVTNPDTAVLFATGPSLKQEIVDTAYKHYDKVYFFGCNDSYLIVPFLDIHYAADLRWWKLHHEIIDTKAEKWTSDLESSNLYGLNHVPGFRKDDIYTGPEFKIHYGWNSGFQIINLAYHFGIRNFLLCGYNMGGDTHFFGDHPYPIRTTSPYDLFLNAFDKITIPGIINCTHPSRLTRFPISTLEEELSKLC
jgi:hypothetical protein